MPPTDVTPLARAAASAAFPAGLAAASRAVISLADQVLDAARPEWGEQLAGLACAAGCTPCCYQVVGVTPAEQAMLAEAITQMPAPRRKRLATRAKALAVKAAGLDPRQYWSAKIPCAALAEDGRCLLHAARPLPCRGFNSADAGICRRSLAGEAARIPVLAVQFTLYGQAQAGLAQALASAGIDPGPLRLVDVLAAITPRR